MNCTARRIINERNCWCDEGVRQEKARAVESTCPTNPFKNSSINKKQVVKGHSSGSAGFKINNNKNQKKATLDQFVLTSCGLCTMEMTRIGFPGQPSP